MNRINAGSACEALTKGFEQNRVFAHMRPYELYGKWLEATGAFLDAANNPREFRDCLDKYSYDEGAEFGRLFHVYTDAVEERPFRDVLGEIFMRVDFSAAANGQVFTPWDIAVLMARMQFSREHFEELVREKGEVSVCDPAVGSGVLLLAFAKIVLDEMGRSGVNKLRLYGTDIDRRCVLMCRIQLRMNGLDAFGRMAGLLAAVPRTHSTPEPSRAVILHGEDWRGEGTNNVKRCAL